MSGPDKDLLLLYGIAAAVYLGPPIALLAVARHLRRAHTQNGAR